MRHLKLVPAWSGKMIKVRRVSKKQLEALTKLGFIVMIV